MSLLEMLGMEKSFNTVQVLNGVDFVLEEGTVHALMGENGAGKSTLMKILAGIHRCDSGRVKIAGQEVEIASPKHSQSLGVAMIHQELSPVPEMTVAENIYLGREPHRGIFLDTAELYRQTEALLGSLKVKVNPKARVGDLKVADQQLVEIAKAISLNAQVIIMDEPTSAITDKEVENLFSIIDDLKRQKKGIVYISHKMDEIFRIADYITILRDGSLVNTWAAKDIDRNTLIKNMVGRELTEIFPKIEVPVTDTLLEIKNFCSEGKFQDVSFTVKRGEIYGIAGLVGSGRTELMDALFGLDEKVKGDMIFNGKRVHIQKPAQAIECGIAYVTEDRKNEGLVLELGVNQNMTMVSMKEMSRGVFINAGVERRTVHKQISKLRIKLSSPAQKVKSLSGGNQQKVVLAKWLIREPKLLILDEPTRGIDVGAKAEIYKLMGAYVAGGNAIIMVSSEMPEVMGLSDRIMVLSNGRTGGELDRKEFIQERIMEMAMSNI